MEIHLTPEQRGSGYQIPTYDNGKFIGWVDVSFAHTLDTNLENLEYKAVARFRKYTEKR
jgi:hypothetical protein